MVVRYIDDSNALKLFSHLFCSDCTSVTSLIEKGILILVKAIKAYELQNMMERLTCYRF